MVTNRGTLDLTGGGVVAPFTFLPQAAKAPGERPPMSPKARHGYLAEMRGRYAAATGAQRSTLLDEVAVTG